MVNALNVLLYLLTQLSINEGPGLFRIVYDDLLDDFTANLIFG